MPHRRTLSSTGILILSLGTTLLAEGPRARFLSPGPEDLIAGPTEIRFAVEDSEPVTERIDVYADGLLIGSARAPGWSLVWDAPMDQTTQSLVAGVYAGGKLVDKIQLKSNQQIRFLDSVDVVAVELFPVVTDRRGRYVGGLTVDDFQVFDQGRPIDIESFSNEPAELSLAVVIDVSRSMAGKLGSVQTSSSRFVDSLGEHDRAAIYAFNHRLTRKVDFTTDRERAKSALRSLQAEGGTALYDAVVRLLEVFRGIRGRKAVVVFSDGRDESSLTSQARTIEAARRNKVIIYTVGTADLAANEDARSDLRVLAEETGGSSHLIEKMGQLSKVFDAILSDLGAQYSLSYTAPPGPSGLRRVVVQPRDSRLRIRYQKSYYFAG